MSYLSSKKTERLFMPYKIVRFLHLLSMVSSRCVVIWFFCAAIHAGAQTIENFRVDAGYPRLPILNKPSTATNLGAIYINDVANGGDGLPYWYDGSQWRPLAHRKAPDGTVIKLIYDAKGRVWMDRNLGAIHGDPVKQYAVSTFDADACGSYFQWCRAADGHQDPASGTYSGGAGNTDNNSGSGWYGKFIINAPRGDWLTTWVYNSNLWWDGGNPGYPGSNNPCPTGYHVPTLAEIDNVNWTGFTFAGRRNNATGVVESIGSNAYYWTSTIAGDGVSYAKHASGNLYIIAVDDDTYTLQRGYGCSVRCIKSCGTINLTGNE